jgi:hypothetical protein
MSRVTWRTLLVVVWVLVGLAGLPERVRAALPQGYAIDISHCTGEITVDDVACWVDSGVQHIIVRAAIAEEIGGSCQSGQPTRPFSIQQLQTLKQALDSGIDFTVDIYLYVHWPEQNSWDTPVADQVSESIDLVTTIVPISATRLWLDLEEDFHPRWTADDAKNLISQSVAVCTERGMPCGMYTGYNFWYYKMGNPTWFRYLPLWFANYDQNPSLDTWSYERFGGWVKPVAKQYSESGNLCGKDTDHNTFYLPVYSVPPAGGNYYPLAGAQFANGASVTLRRYWVPYATHYQFHVQYQDEYGAWPGYAYFTQPGLNRKTFTPTYPNTKYRWRVRAKNHVGWSGYSGYRTFIIGSLCTTPPCPESATEGESNP